jgi:hypothetical protein
MTRFRAVAKLCAAGALMVGLVSACGSSGNTPSNIVHRKSAATEKGESHWSVNVSGASGAPSGKWRIDWNPKTHTATLTTPANKPFSTGLIQAGNKVKFPPLQTCSGQSQPASGLYSYTMSSSQLTFTKQSDSCPTRSAILTKQPWSTAAAQ